MKTSMMPAEASKPYGEMKLMVPTPELREQRALVISLPSRNEAFWVAPKAETLPRTSGTTTKHKHAALRTTLTRGVVACDRPARANNVLTKVAPSSQVITPHQLAGIRTTMRAYYYMRVPCASQLHPAAGFRASERA